MPLPTSDTAALLTPSVRARVVEALPGARIRAIRPLGQGWGAAAFRVPSEDGTWVLRLPRPRSYWAMPDLEREVRLHQPGAMERARSWRERMGDRPMPHLLEDPRADRER